MRGHVRQRGKKWSVVIDEGKDETGKRKQRWYSGFRTEREAERKLTSLLGQLDNGTYVEPTKETVKQFLERWLKDYVWPNVAPRTAEGYEHIVKRHLIPALGNVQLVKLSPGQIQAYYAAKTTAPGLRRAQPLSPRTVRHHHVTLHDALQSAVKQGLLGRNPADATDPPKFQRPEMKTLDDDGLRTFLEAAKETPYFSLF